MTDTRAIALEAAHWFIDLREHGATRKRWDDFFAWLNATPQHRRMFLEIEAAWRAAGRLKFTAAHSPAKRAPGSLIELSSVSGTPQTATRPRFSRITISYGGLAAAVLIAIAIGYSWLKPQPVTGVTYIAAVGEMRPIALDDGSTATLNTDSEIEVRYSMDEREIRLVRGEALFDVQHDESRPFNVDVINRTVRAVGTQFSVSIPKSQEADVVVAEGQVEIDPRDGFVARMLPSTGKKSVRLKAGDLAQVRRAGVTIVHLSPEALQQKLAWRDGMLWFRGEPLLTVITEFNRYNRRQLVLADATLSEEPINGRFSPTDLDGFVSALELGGVASVQAENDKEIRLARPKGVKMR